MSSNKIENRDLVKLLTDEELPEFLRFLEVAFESPVSREEAVRAAEQCSATRVLAAIAHAACDALTMLLAILDFLAEHDAELRTTGHVIALPGLDTEFRPELRLQNRAMQARFSRRSFTKKALATWEEALTFWQSSIEPWLDNTLREAYPSGGWHFGRFGPNIPVYEIHADDESCDRFIWTWRTLAYLDLKLHEATAPSKTRTPANHLIDEIKQAVWRFTDCARHLQSTPEFEGAANQLGLKALEINKVANFIGLAAAPIHSSSRHGNHRAVTPSSSFLPS